MLEASDLAHDDWTVKAQVSAAWLQALAPQHTVSPAGGAVRQLWSLWGDSVQDGWSGRVADGAEPREHVLEMHIRDVYTMIIMIPCVNEPIWSLKSTDFRVVIKQVRIETSDFI